MCNEYKCPACGKKDQLKVVRATVIGDMPLTWDGFEVTGSTEDEIVHCDNCNHEGPMEDFIPTAKEGKCPKCGADLGYGTGEPIENEYAYPVTCYKCNFSGREWYLMKFNGHTDNDGKDC